MDPSKKRGSNRRGLGHQELGAPRRTHEGGQKERDQKIREGV